MTETRQLASLFSSMLPYLERAWRRESDIALAVHNLSVATALPLVAIGRLGDGIRQVVLAEALVIEEASLSPILTQLCAAGLVERRPDARDRRANTLHLTPSGVAAARKAEAALAAVRAHLLRHVDPTDLAAALRVFHAIERSVGRSKMPPAEEPT
jgi:MarR family transcriptional regulator for hemolysin